MTPEVHAAWQRLVERCTAEPGGHGRVRLHPEMRQAVIEMDVSLMKAWAEAKRWMREAAADRMALAEYRKRWPAPRQDESAEAETGTISEGRHEGVTEEGEGSAEPGIS